jgi:N-acyl-D-amino-acid deacylase
MKLFAVLLLVSFFQAALMPALAKDETTYDLVIVNGRIVDGTGNPWFAGSVAIKDGRIAQVGRVDAAKAKQVIDAKGQIVAPGFIDVHAHTENIFEQPVAENFVRMGVTTLVTGNCGGSHVDIGKFLGTIKEKPLAVNISTLVGHNTVRAEVMGLADRAPTAEEQQKMNALVEKAMQDGAVGLSTGLIYLPGTFAKTDEVVGLAKAASKFGGTYASHIRDEGVGVLDAITKLSTSASRRKCRSRSHISRSPRDLSGGRRIRHWGSCGPQEIAV